MLSEEEKAHIIEKVQFENAIKKELSDSAKPKKYGWIESKIVLLLIGALITGILVPTFQYTQKLWEWKRQNQFANLTFSLTMMRDCLREFNYLSAFAPEAYERIKPALKGKQLTSKEYDDLEHEYVDLQNRRFTQNAKVISLMVHFKDTKDFQNLFEDEYSIAFNLYMRDIDEFIRISRSVTLQTPNNLDNKVAERLDKLKDQLNSKLMELKASHQKVVYKMKEEIGRVEDEGRKFGL